MSKYLSILTLIFLVSTTDCIASSEADSEPSKSWWSRCTSWWSSESPEADRASSLPPRVLHAASDFGVFFGVVSSSDLIQNSSIAVTAATAAYDFIDKSRYYISAVSQNRWQSVSWWRLASDTTMLMHYFVGDGFAGGVLALLDSNRFVSMCSSETALFIQYSTLALALVSDIMDISLKPKQE